MSATTVPFTEVDQDKEQLRVHLRRFLRAPRERVFAAWTEPEQMKRWHGPEGWETLEASSDPRPGGTYRIVMRGMAPAMGDEPAQMRTGAATGEYLEVRRPELLRFTWRGDWIPGQTTTVTVRLEEAEGGTMLELTHEGFPTEADARGHERGWNGSVPKLARVVEQGS